MSFPVEIALIILFSIVGGIIALRLRQPLAIGLLLIGSLVGPYALGFIKNFSLINTSIEIGAIMLLFIIGIEFNMQSLLKAGFKGLFVAILKVGSVFLVSYYASLLLGFSFIAALNIGVILSITSTVILIKIMEQKGMSEREELPLLVSVLIIEDVLGVFLLTFFSSIHSQADLRPINVLGQILFSFLIMVIAYFIIQRIVKRFVLLLEKYNNEDMVTLVSLGLCGGMSYVAFLLGLSPTVGAFLAGNIAASLPNSAVFKKSINPFILVFTALFFFSIGTIVNYGSVIGNGIIILVLFIVSMAAKFIAMGLFSYIFADFRGKQSVFSGIAMMPIGEFSLLIAAESNSFIPEVDLVGITAIVIVLSSISMSLLISRHERIYELTNKLIPSGAIQDLRSFSAYINTILNTFQDKFSIKNIKSSGKSIFSNVMFMVFIGSLLFFFWKNFHNYFILVIKSHILLYLAITVFLLVILMPALNIIKNVNVLVSDIFSFFIELYPSAKKDNRKSFINLIVLSALFICLSIFPEVSSFLNLPSITQVIPIGLLIFIVYFIFKESKLVAYIRKQRKKHLKALKKKFNDIR